MRSSLRRVFPRASIRPRNNFTFFPPPSPFLVPNFIQRRNLIPRFSPKSAGLRVPPSPHVPNARKERNPFHWPYKSFRREGVQEAKEKRRKEKKRKRQSERASERATERKRKRNRKKKRKAFASRQIGRRLLSVIKRPTRNAARQRRIFILYTRREYSGQDYPERASKREAD